MRSKDKPLTKWGLLYCPSVQIIGTTVKKTNETARLLQADDDSAEFCQQIAKKTF